MQADVLRVYKTVHTWTGIVSGLALFIAFYAGALTVFKEPIARWASPPATTAAVPLEDAPALIARALEAHPAAAAGFSLILKPDAHRPARMDWAVPEDPGHQGHPDALSMRHYAASLRADGTAQVDEVEPSTLAEFIDVLHRVVGLPVDSDMNRWIMGVIAVLYTLALVSGVILVLPTLVSDLFALRLGANLKRLWRDAHNVVGVFSLPFHVVMALTAAVFAFHDGLYAVQDTVIHGGQLAGAWGPPPQSPDHTAPRDPATMRPPADLVAQVRSLSPSFEPDILQYQGVTGPRAVVRVWGHDRTALSPRTRGGFVSLDPYSGRVLTTAYLPGQQNAGMSTLSAIFALHFGTYGGAPVAWAYFGLGLAGAWLFYSGNLLWIESRRKRQRRGEAVPRQRRDTDLMAAGTVGVCLGCVCGISLTIVAGKWLHGVVGDLTLWHQIVYYAAFFGCIGWAFWRGAARAGVDLLWLAAAITAAIPATTALAVLVEGVGVPSGLWAHMNPAALGVDATALVGALAFAAMARGTRRRVRSGPTDSVWSAAGAGHEPLSAPES
ncbi:PepSY domain-containing protein [Roseospira marina]|uniref:PepSY domain-containing protein n=1 Tax=Roseospira marina TaxID=140057 RepID=A0A5M6I845_9PROT|nr:PepSY-associated TM helix domain-containing protein [Roseospira marina]KAA5604322.1 PepSY domain-containing protein [Roseospira marina]MBB4315654.1 putative iron-regulated membrane protein [Roseospira marina]MBB5088712.1 putative iron-regulated membrane protein [Roseospira marina]